MKYKIYKLNELLSCQVSVTQERFYNDFIKNKYKKYLLKVKTTQINLIKASKHPIYPQYFSKISLFIIKIYYERPQLLNTKL